MSAIEFELKFLTIITEITEVFRLLRSALNRHAMILLRSEFANYGIIPVCVHIFRVGPFLEEFQFFVKVWLATLLTALIHIDVILIQCSLI